MRPETSLAPFADGMSHLILFRSFGKFFGLAGLRLGFVIANAAILEAFEDWLGPWAVSGPALSIAASLFARDQGAIRERIAERRQALQNSLSSARLTVAGGTELFALVADRRASDIYSHLARHHILVRKFEYAAEWLRFGLCPDENADMRLSRALAELKT
jgi:cobalamin biosynthetic protein CobC